ncbi:dystrophin-1-like [Maniola jurtina]|uniref:dystrophin-1-like n=1 Tax=Maniola jurtina TaxID=191418 RepID=UPI001E688119|nr:dystrophin-1-like [Maniola jurtina]XP_045777554.1 dystrophin-1-like [Maniola jurtina]
MELLKWKKVENEAGYPCYIDETNGKQHYDHPQFSRILKTLEEYNDIKYSAYRIAFKLFALQKNLKVPPLRISSGVFARHQLSLSESSLSLDTAELEAVLADIYFAAEKEGLFSGDVDLAVDLLINLLLNVYDEERKTSIRVLAAKTLLILLSEESIAEKWQALANCCADHNGCVSPRRLAALLAHVTALPKYLGCQCDHLQSDLDSCFAKNAGMLGVSSQAVAEWGVHGCSSTRWLGVVQRVVDSRSSANVSAGCSACGQPLIQVLKFKCAKCNDVYFCEKCYLYGKELSSVPSHKKTHLVQELIDGEIKAPECLSFIKGMKRFFFCTKTRKKKTSKMDKKNKQTRQSSLKRKEKPVIFTSTVGKASGNKTNNPAMTLQDIITNMENDTKALKDLMDQMDTVVKAGDKDSDEQLKGKAEVYYSQISAQIARLKTLKDNFLNPDNFPPETKSEKLERPQAFDLFSPIPVVDGKQSKVTENSKNQPRVLSLDSGNFSVADKPDSQHLLTMSGDALKPVVVHATSDSISTVSMNDMSNWYNETETTNKRNATKTKLESNHSISATEKRFAADIRSVENSNDKMRELNADLDTVLDRLQQILTNNFAMDDSCFDNTQLRETASEMEGLLGTLIRGVEQRATLNANNGLV